jgi:hypothetical protein
MQFLILVCLHGCIDGQRVQGIHRSVGDCAYDPGWTDDVPVCPWVCLAVCEEFVLLRVVEVGLDRVARIRLDVRSSCWALVDLGLSGGLEQGFVAQMSYIVILCASLQKNPFWLDVC